MTRRKKSRIDVAAEPVNRLESLAMPSQEQPSIHSAVIPEPHCVERAVLHGLLAVGEVTFQELTVRRTPEGLCLQGVVECTEAEVDLCSVARRVSGIDSIANRLVMRSSHMAVFH